VESVLQWATILHQELRRALEHLGGDRDAKAEEKKTFQAIRVMRATTAVVMLASSTVIARRTATVMRKMTARSKDEYLESSFRPPSRRRRCTAR
jgi:hypothetical protein